MREVYYVEIKVEDEKNIELVKNTVLMCAEQALAELAFAIEDTWENVKERYVTNNLTESEQIKLEELCKKNDSVQNTEITQNTITLYLTIDDIIDGEATAWFYDLVSLAEILPDINFELRLERRNDTIGAYSRGEGAYKNGSLWYYGTEVQPECTVHLNGKEYFCDEYTVLEGCPEFYESGKIIDRKYVSLENVNITNLKDVVVCFTDFKYYAGEKFLTKIITQSGGLVRNAVSGKTDYLIYNPESDYETSKLRKAKELNESGKNIKIVTIEEFIEILQIVTKNNLTKEQSQWKQL